LDFPTQTPAISRDWDSSLAPLSELHHTEYSLSTTAAPTSLSTPASSTKSLASAASSIVASPAASTPTQPNEMRNIMDELTAIRLMITDLKSISEQQQLATEQHKVATELTTKQINNLIPRMSKLEQFQQILQQPSQKSSQHQLHAQRAQELPPPNQHHQSANVQQSQPSQQPKCAQTSQLQPPHATSTLHHQQHNHFQHPKNPVRTTQLPSTQLLSTLQTMNRFEPLRFNDNNIEPFKDYDEFQNNPKSLQPQPQQNHQKTKRPLICLTENYLKNSIRHYSSNDRDICFMAVKKFCTSLINVLKLQFVFK